VGSGRTTRGTAAARAARHGALALLALGVTAGGANADAIDELADAVARFRGIGARSVDAYVVPLELPDEDAEDATPLLEAWRAPAELVLAGGDPAVPRAVVRSWALFLEPMFVARTSLLGMDLDAGAERLRATAELAHGPAADGGTLIELGLGAASDPALPDMLQDVARLAAELDAAGRVRSLEVALRSQTRGVTDRIALTCTYDAADGDLPGLAEWTLPDGQLVRVSTSFRTQAGIRVPHERDITFPSRWDPGETEEIHVRYGEYAFGRGTVDERLHGTEPFRYDANGLVGD